MTDHNLDGLHPTEEEMAKIFRVLRDLNLHGVMMLGHPCLNCGALHSITTVSDIDAEAVAVMMIDYLDQDEEGEGIRKHTFSIYKGEN